MQLQMKWWIISIHFSAYAQHLKNYNILTDGKGHVNLQISLAIYSLICWQLKLSSLRAPTSGSHQQD